LLIYAALTTYGTRIGIGKHITDIDVQDLTPALKYLYLGEFFAIIAVPTSKTSFSITLLRLSVVRWHRWFIWFIMVSMNLVMWICALLLFVQCSPVEKNWNRKLRGQCWSPRIQINFSIFAGSYSVLMDFMLATCPWLIIRHLQMNTKEKLGVIVAMSLGFLAGVTAAIKTSFLPSTQEWTDSTYALADLLIWALAESAVTIIAASIPFLRVLIKNTSAYQNTNPYSVSFRLESTKLDSTNKNISSQSRKPGLRQSITGWAGTGRPDDLSDKSILGEERNVGMGPGREAKGRLGGIMRSDEVRIEYTEGETESQAGRIESGKGQA
ncbi:hypothetical protein K469DRAFT_804852, partial [Zopfia rhizophila CBS 207.26]